MELGGCVHSISGDLRNPTLRKEYQGISTIFPSRANLRSKTHSLVGGGKRLDGDGQWSNWGGQSSHRKGSRAHAMIFYLCIDHSPSDGDGRVNATWMKVDSNELQRRRRLI